MKKNSIIFPLLTVLFTLSCCNKPTEPPEITIKNVTIVETKLSIDTITTFDFSRKLLLNNVSSQFPLKLARFMYVSIFDATKTGYARLDESTNLDPANNTDFLTHLGFSNIEEKIAGEEAEIDVNDTEHYIISSQQLNDTTVAINLSLLGTQSEGTNEWSSNFDVGNNSKEYTDITGSHNEWTDINNHKGYDVAANRILEQIKNYVSQHVNPSMYIKFFVSGYSRGGGVANVLGAKLEKKKLNVSNQYESTTLTFASSNTTEATDCASYSTIFNICNYDDVVTRIPTPSFGMKRYGKDYAISLEENNLDDKWAEIKGSTYSTNNVNDLVTTLDGVIGTRENMYVIDTSENATAVYEDDSFLTSAFKYGYMVGNASTYGFDKYMTISTPTQVGTKYQFTIQSCNALLLAILDKALPELMAGDTSNLMTYGAFLNSPKYTSVLSKFTSVDKQSIANCHLPTSYDILLDFVIENIESF